MLKKVLELTKNFDYHIYNDNDVKIALNKDSLSFKDLGALLSPTAENFLESIAQRAKKETRKFFGNSISLYTPLYISNFCQNQCVYCGFNAKNKIKRNKLSLLEIENEFFKISQTGLKEILILTGEDREKSDLKYIGDTIVVATKYFSTIGVEIYPLEIEEYKYINSCGADFVSIYQETYDTTLYDKIHPSGPKKDFAFRFHAQERAIKGGMRGVSFGVLLGLGDFRKDAFSTALHAYLLQQKYPFAEISISVPRLKPFINNIDCILEKGEEICNVTEKNLLQTILAYRLFLPFVSISISTRERAEFRDNVIGLAATKISAEVKTSVGGHIKKKGDEQFEISDSRTVAQIHEAIQKKGLQPVYKDYI